MRSPREAVKTALRCAGLFPVARSLLRRMSRGVRAGLAADCRLYGRFIRSGDLVFDVGANLGQKSEVFLALGARVVGIEPNPLCAPSLRWQFGRHRHFHLVPKALADRPGRMQLNAPGTSSTASLRDDWKWLGLTGQRPKKVDVEVTTLDALIAEFGVPRFCKIDVEGFEPEVLRGLSRPLPCVTFEYHVEELDRLRACLVRLDALGRALANVIPMDGESFVWPLWSPLGDFRTDGLPAVGDCFVVAEGAGFELGG
jgi:FkbM family methyltransferase